MNDIVLNKKASIERCIQQIRKYYDSLEGSSLEDDFMVQDAIAINLQRACEQCIDLANHTIRTKKLGLPKESKESFQLLAKGGVIPSELSVKLEKMVGFRNVLVHEYQQLQVSRMVDVIENHLDDLLDYTNWIVKAFSEEED